MSGAFTPNEIREGLGIVESEIDDLLAAERGADGTYEVSAIEVDIADLIHWQAALREAVRT